MNETVHISADAPAKASQNYSALREGGMEWIRRWARQSWTDHNIHDPGVTILEAASYAMTELGLRLQLDLADLLRSGESRAPANLEPAHRVMPVGPVNSQDQRCVLLDHPLVSDAQIFRPAENEVRFYEAASDPPLTYAPGTPRVPTGGLYEVLVELAQRDLNSNTYELSIVSAGQQYDLEIALPFWDDAEAAPFRSPATINIIAMIVDAGEVWRALPESQSFYGKLNVAYTDSSGNPGGVELWALMRITMPLAQPAVVVPGILNSAQTAIETNVAGATLAQFAERVRSAALSVRRLDAYVAGWRNLGEQAVRIGLVRVQEVAVRARIEITGGIDVEQLLARIFMDIDALLSPVVRFESLVERRGRADDPDRIYDGPLLRRGFIDRETLSAPRQGVLYTSDVLRLIMQRRSRVASDVVTQENQLERDIVAVIDLTLSNFINNRPITTDAEDCLHLVEIDRYRPRLSLAKSRIVVVRNESEVSYDANRVQAIFSGLQNDARERAVTDDPSWEWPVAAGDSLPIGDFAPLQNELPALYGVGDAALPNSVGPQRHAAAKQLKGYLLLFEQYLGDMTEQLANINLFYAGNAGESPTYFVRPPFDLPDARALLRRFTGVVPWQTFIADPNNPVTRALHQAAEHRERLLDRRNRMLDHLLARQGDDAVALGQELHRWAQVELVAASLPAGDKELRIKRRREAANARLLRCKAALLRELPELAAFRLLANSNPFVGNAALVNVEPVTGGFRWQLSLGGPRLRARDPETSIVAAAIAAERAASFAGRASNYAVVDIGGGQRRLQLLDGTGTAAVVLGESTLVFGSVADANTALAGMAEAFAIFRIEMSLSPMERRVAYHAGIRDPRRRRSLTPTNVHFEIFAEAAGPGLFGRRWRLRETPGAAGTVLLTSPIRFDAPTEPQAIELAQNSIRQVLRHGLDEWNYHVVGTFGMELRDPGGTVLAVMPGTLATEAAAQAAAAATADILYRVYGAENLHLLEHLLLRPRNPADTFLSIPDGESTRERDPYSHRVSLILCSGRARDFSLPHATAPTTEMAPDRFRDPEFRRHMEGMIQRMCPAHLMPTLYWVDGQLPGTPGSPASFDAFEARYFTWLDSLLIPGATDVAISAARNQLVESLNAIANDAA